jgi:hypothetical protein
MLDFLKPHKVKSETFSLSSGEQVSIQKYFLEFKEWRGAPVQNTYNGKSVIDWNGEPAFAELAVLRLFQSRGWDGVWVDSYGRKYRVGMQGLSEPIDLPAAQAELIESIRQKTGRFGGCWDVVAWKDRTALFLELKREKKDAIQSTQTEWLAAALALGLSPDNFALIEWDIAPQSLEFEYPEDRKFFIDFLAGGDEKRFNEEFSDYFDFRHPAIKRGEFKKTRKQALKNLLDKYGEVCQLRLHPDCSKERIWEPDHIVPLSTNELNKKLRHLERVGDAKVAPQSFGSNHPKNLTLACKRCNAFKKHRLIPGN